MKTMRPKFQTKTNTMEWGYGLNLEQVPDFLQQNFNFHTKYLEEVILQEEVTIIYPNGMSFKAYFVWFDWPVIVTGFLDHKTRRSGRMQHKCNDSSSIYITLETGVCCIFLSPYLLCYAIISGGELKKNRKVKGHLYRGLFRN